MSEVHDYLKEVKALVGAEAVFDPKTGAIQGMHQSKFHLGNSDPEMRFCPGCRIIVLANRIEALIEPGTGGPIFEPSTGKVYREIPHSEFPELVELGPGEPVPFPERKGS